MNFSSRYATRTALAYYLLSFPAIALQVLFSLSVTANPQAIVPQVSSLGPSLTSVVELVPWVLLAVSLLAVVRFKPSILVILLSASFLVAASATQGTGFFSSTLTLEETVAIVIAASFMALIGFNYSRATKILSGRKATTLSHGPLGYQLLSSGVELALPFGAAIGLVALVSFVVAGLTVQAKLLPEPVSTLSSLYLATHLGFVFVSILVAGAFIWVMRQFIEPILLYYTINRRDGVLMALDEVKDLTKRVGKEASRKPSAGRWWFGAAVALAVGVMTGAVLVVGSGAMANSFLSVLGLHPVSTLPGESSWDSGAGATLRNLNALVLQGQDAVRTLIRLLWG